VEDKESLKSGTVVSQLTGAVQDQVNDLLSDGVVTTGVVVSSILLSGDQLLGVVQLSVGSGADLVDDRGFQIDVNGTGNVLSSTSFTEKGVESIVSSSDSLVRGHLTVGLDSVLKAIKLPASVTDLDTGLSNVDGDYFAHFSLSLVDLIKVGVRVRTWAFDEL
jgi:hypothetical protein